MKGVAAAEKLQTRTEPDEWLYLGRLGWLICAFAVLANVYVGFQVLANPAVLAGYALFCVVAGYVIVLFWKQVLRFVDNI